MNALNQGTVIDAFLSIIPESLVSSEMVQSEFVYGEIRTSVALGNKIKLIDEALFLEVYSFLSRLL